MTTAKAEHDAKHTPFRAITDHSKLNYLNL